MEKKKLDIKEFISPNCWDKEYMEINYGGFRDYIKELIKQYPNDQELGRELRKLLNDDINESI